MKRILSLILALGVLFSLTACTPPGLSEPESDRDGTTVLSVFNFDGGVGTTWLYDLKPLFEAQYENVSFEEGKMGVTIDIVPNKSDISSVLAQGYHVIFNEEIPFNDLIAQNKILDITDVVTSSLSDVSNGAEPGTIQDKLDESQVKALTAKGGNYYALPHYEVYTGLAYDADLFKEKALYFAKDGGWTDDPSEKTCGPDGDFATEYDNGLPSSYEEFYTLMKKMVDETVAPFVFTEQLPRYTNDLLAGLWAAYSGKDEFLLNVNFDSEGTNTKARIMVEEGGNLVEKEVSIDMSNGYLMSQQSGKYYAFDFLEKIATNGDYRSEKVTGSLSHTGAQEQFIYSNLEGKTAPIAMLIEGSYWYNEARDYINRSENTYKDRAKNRNLAWMPLPRQYKGTVTEGNGKKNTLLETLSSFAVINASIKDNAGLVNCAKTFLKYCYTNKALVDFTLKSGTPKGVEYTMTKDELNQLPPYQRSLMELKAVSDIIYPYSNNPIFVNHQSVFDYDQGSKIWETNSHLVAYLAFKDNGVSAKQYFLGTTISQSDWVMKYSKYFK